jgi:ABC-type multidrug transport system ATPase subunit
VLAIETRGLTKSFGRTSAVVGLDLEVPAGSIYGFIGPNGAGKTTTIRLLLGLLSPSSGTISVNGEPFSRDRRSLLRGVGALVEQPSIYPNLTGRENLEVTRRLVDAPPSRIDDVVGQFDLSGYADTLAGTYSSGMRQSLGLALAWLGRPTLLILDEPSNGLDPVAVRRLRGHLRDEADRGTTVFVSSHALAEIDQLADVVGVVHRGRLRFQGTLTSLRHAHAGSLEDIVVALLT